MGAMTVSQNDLLDCFCDELSRHGTVDRAKLEAEMFGDDSEYDPEYDVRNGPFGDDYRLWLEQASPWPPAGELAEDVAF